MTQEPGASSAHEPERKPTGIPGLDEVLSGGLSRGGSYLVTGQPGSGKSVLGNHIAYNHARSNGVAVFATTLAESHGRMVAHLSSFRFFSQELVAQTVHYVNIYPELSRGGLAGVLELLRRLVREHRATLLVLDGAGVLGDFAPSAVDYRRFIYDLHAQLSALDCTWLLLADSESRYTQSVETVVDGLLMLEDQRVGLRDVRLLHVRKLRGVEYLRGRHAFAIAEEGIEVYPRLEAALATMRPVVGDRRGRLPFGVQGLDDMLCGGVPAGSSTLLLGAPGAGKTLVGLHFIVDGARRGEPGIVLGFHETPSQLVGKARSIGLELDRYVQDGRVQILWQPPVELLVDAWTRATIAALEQHRPRRLLLDGVANLQRLSLFPERLPAYLAALAGELQARGITSVLGAETEAILGAPFEEAPIPALSAVVENIILLRYVELRSHLRRLLSIIKMREVGHDNAIREFFVTSEGVRVADTFESAEAVLTGSAHLVPPTAADTGRRQRRGRSGR